MHIAADQMYYDYKLMDGVDNIIVCNDNNIVVPYNDSGSNANMIDDFDVEIMYGNYAASMSPSHTQKNSH